MQESAAGAFAGTILLENMEISDQHFAEDPEVLEDFALGRLDRDTLARCEEHLRACETCRHAVYVERIMAAGIKRAGRDRLKERLGMLSGMPSRRQIPWPHVLSVAAVLLVLVGVGIYQRWFVTPVEQRDISQLEQPQVIGKEAKTAPLDAAHPSESAARQLDAEQPRQSEENNVKAQDDKLRGAPAPMNRVEKSSPAASKDKRRTDIASMKSAAMGGGQEFWANGTLITETLSKKEADEGRAAKTALSGAVQAPDVSRAKRDAFGRFTVEQRPAWKLPATQQTQQLYDRQTIQTLVRQSEGETQLTLYPSSPFDSTQLHFARVQQVTPDSLVVQIGSQRIGYRFPVGKLEQTQSESEKTNKR